MSVTVTRGEVCGYPSIVLENRYLRASIIPQLGARVWELEDRLRGRQWIWHRDSTRLRMCPVGAVYDDVWAGGWEEIFPNDAPGVFEGRDLPDHGEWWAASWEVQSSCDGCHARVCLSTSLQRIKASCRKEFRLESDSNTLVVRYSLHSEEARPFHFLFKQHLPIAIDPGCRLALPGGEMEAVDRSFGALGSASGPCTWPLADLGSQSLDLRVVPDPASAQKEFLYVKNLPAHWCGVDDLGRDASLRMSFDPGQLPFVWLFLAYGGWRWPVYVAVLEPCSNLPKDLSEAVRLGQAARLEPGEEFSTEISVTLGGLSGRLRGPCDDPLATKGDDAQIHLLQ
jgi:hypothetical protein